MKTQDPFPPRAFVKLFRWFCHPGIVDYIEGDLLEVYYKRVNKSGKRITGSRSFVHRAFFVVVTLQSLLYIFEVHRQTITLHEQG